MKRRYSGWDGREHVGRTACCRPPARQRSALTAEVTFACTERTPTYELVCPSACAAGESGGAGTDCARRPGWLLALLVFSLLCALVYSRYITPGPSSGMSGIAGRMERIWISSGNASETRRDEIGAAGPQPGRAWRKSLSAALAEPGGMPMRRSGATWSGSRKLERQRLAFFSAASHELKTPVTILKGQLTGMLDGVGVYRDREKYLARSLAGDRADGRADAGDPDRFAAWSRTAAVPPGGGGAVRPDGRRSWPRTPSCWSSGA